MKPWTGFCQRCGTQTDGHIMSMFNLDLICLPCKDKEEQHPLYDKAVAAEAAEVKKGNHSFPGIGWKG